MCGIAGIVDSTGRPISRERLGHARTALAHRGPDDHGTWIRPVGPGPTVGLAHTRLAVIAPRPEGRQPLSDADGRVVGVFNGEIYNFQALRAELAAAGVTLRTRTDTEVLVAGFAVWGPALFDRLDGMWACALVDVGRGAGVLCRDRFGIKPLVYADIDGQLCFASELRALRTLLPRRPGLATAVIPQFLRAGHIGWPDTIYEGCHVLPPGHLLTFDERGVHAPQRYHHLRPQALSSGALPPDAWRPPDAVRPPDALHSAHAVSACRDAIDASVRARMIADVPVGAFLSGGLDSSIVAYHAARHAGGTLQTFSIGYDDAPRFDESGHARAVAAALGTVHHDIRLRHADVTRALPDLLDHIGQPFGDASLVPTALLSQACRRQVTVALSGDGADELFGGYWRYAGQRYLEHYERLPAIVRAALARQARGRSLGRASGWRNRIRQFQKLLRAVGAAPLARHRAWTRILDPAAEAQLAAAPWPDDETAEQRLARCVPAHLRDLWADDPLNLILLLDLHTQLPDDMLHKVDLASMAASLEVRVPMLAPTVVAAAVGLPSRLKVRGTTTKWILRQAYRGLLPDAVLTRAKMGFEVPVGEFLRGPLRQPFLDTVTPRACAALPAVSHAGAAALFAEHATRRADHTDVLYALFGLCRFVTNAGYAR